MANLEAILVDPEARDGLREHFYDHLGDLTPEEMSYFVKDFMGAAESLKRPRMSEQTFQIVVGWAKEFAEEY